MLPSGLLLRAALDDVGHNACDESLDERLALVVQEGIKSLGPILHSKISGTDLEWNWVGSLEDEVHGVRRVDVPRFVRRHNLVAGFRNGVHDMF
jgi:hypothetical protein